MLKVAVITGTRADYGVLKPVLKGIVDNPHLDLLLITVGMHMSTEFGYTVEEIKKDGFTIVASLNILHEKDTRGSMARSVGKLLMDIIPILENLKPNFLLLLGDRSEMLVGAVAATYLGIPIAHIHGGDVSGNVDDPVRHAITKLAHIHFPATPESAKRIIKMGEEPFRVHVVGAPGLDFSIDRDIPKPKEIAKKYNLTLSKPVLLVVQHSVIAEADQAANQIRKTLNAIVSFRYQTIIIYPNSDVGGRKMIKVIQEFKKEYPFIQAFKSLPHNEYLGLMNMASVLIGNSSSGIIEAPFFGLPVINIGTRQKGRQRASNVIDVSYDEEKIQSAIDIVLFDDNFRKNINNFKNFYSKKDTGTNIAKILSNIKINDNLLEKRMIY